MWATEATTTATSVTVWHYPDGTTVVTYGGSYSGTEVSDEFLAAQLERNLREFEELTFEQEAKRSATRDSWAHLHRLTVVGRRQRARRRKRSRVEYIDDRCRGPPVRMTIE